MKRLALLALLALASPLAAQEEDYRRAVSMARNYALNGNTERAAATLARFVEEFPDALEAAEATEVIAYLEQGGARRFEAARERLEAGEYAGASRILAAIAGFVPGHEDGKDARRLLDEIESDETIQQAIRDEQARREALELQRSRATARTVAGFRWLREETFRCGGVARRVHVYRSDVFAAALGLAEDETDVACEFVLVDPGQLVVVSAEDADLGWAVQHPYLIARTEVTQRVYGTLMNGREAVDAWPSHFDRGDSSRHPVDSVSWQDLHGREETFRVVAGFLEIARLELPTEGQWELACRAGSETPYFFGPADRGLDRYAWFGQEWDSRESSTHEVALKKPNALGLFDGYGNVAEWCSEPYLRKTEVSGRQEWVDTGHYPLRGGDYHQPASQCRSSYRGYGERGVRWRGNGFRPVRNLPVAGPAGPEPAGTGPGVAYRYFEADFIGLPSFDGQPRRTGVVESIGLAGIGHRPDRFAVCFEAHLLAAGGGLYTFFLESDDGSRLLVDGQVVIDNDGLHAPIELAGDVFLEAGWHRLAVEFFESQFGEVLEVSWSGPGFDRGPIPTSVLRVAKER